jgi:hypothetical protein
MNQQSTSSVISPHDLLSPEDAWVLWNQISMLADVLWRSYEKEFLEFCIREEEKKMCGVPQPSD